MNTRASFQKCPALVGVLLVTSITPLAAIQIANFTTLTNDRFANDASFVANQFNLSGVGFNGSTGTSLSPGWATMISENVYITAAHFAPGVGTNMTFYASNDPDGTSVTRAITPNRQKIGSTDIYVGTLDAGLPVGFSFYDFATEDISALNGLGSFSKSIYNGANAYVFGRSPTSFPSSQNMAVGRNVLDQFTSGQTVGASTGDVIIATDERPAGVAFEAMLEGGDSGGPLLVDNGQGGLTIVGINWFIGTTSGGDDIFGASYLGNYDEDIQAFINANPVPEPASLALLLSVACGLAVLRRRA